jgi:hypothetical protein
VVLQALGVPDGLRRRAREDRGGLVDLADSRRRPRTGEEGGERVGSLGANALNSSSRAAGSTRRGGRRVQVVGDPGLRGLEAHAGRGGDRDALDPGPGALGHRVERADVLDLVAEEVEPVGLGAVTG